MDIFLSVVGLLVLLVCFWLWMASFSVCSLFGLPFVLLCFLSVYPFLSLSRYVPYPFRSMACKNAAALRCRSFPESIRRHRRDRRDIDPMAGPESSPISDGRVEDHPFPQRIDLVHWVRNRPGRPPPHFFSWTDIGPNNPKWTESDIGFNGWKFPISEPQGTCHTDGSSDPVLDL